MHHGWPNLGHDALVHAVQNAVCDLRERPRTPPDWRCGVISYDVRRGHAMPEPPGGRHAIYIGTGGPGHLDPGAERRRARLAGHRRGPGVGSAALPRCSTRFAPTPDASLFAVCHTFGVMCRWLGIADAVLRGSEKGGKSTGIVENVLHRRATGPPLVRAASHGPSPTASDFPSSTTVSTISCRSADRCPGVALLATRRCDAGRHRGRRADDGRSGTRSRRAHPAHSRRESPSGDRQSASPDRDCWRRSARAAASTNEWFAERLADADRSRSRTTPTIACCTSRRAIRCMAPLRFALYREVAPTGGGARPRPGFDSGISGRWSSVRSTRSPLPCSR